MGKEEERGRERAEGKGGVEATGNAKLVPTVAYLMI
jgi:hypothetical protein